MRRVGRHVMHSRFAIGMITLATVAGALMIASQAERGLPLVPATTLYAELPNASGLRTGNKVHVGGEQVGVILDLRPVRRPDGTVVARAKLRVERIPRLPVDSTLAVRPISPLGLKYVELTVGRSSRTLRDGATVAVSRTQLPVDLDRVLGMFDPPTRRAVQDNAHGYGDALSARGGDLNRFIAAAPALATELEQMAGNLSRPRTDLGGFIRGLDRFTQALAPVSSPTARLVTEMADTFEALTTDQGQPLRDSIAATPATLDVGTRSLRSTRPFLERVAALSGDLNDAAAALDTTLPPITAALRTGTPVIRRSVGLSGRLESTLVALDRLTAAPTTGGALRGLTATVNSLKPTLRYLGPFVTVCNYWNTFFGNYAGFVNEPTKNGTVARQLFVVDSKQDDALGSLNANEFVHGANVAPGGVPEHLHAYFGLPAVTEDGRADCQWGQTGYPERGEPLVPDQKTYGRVVVKPSRLQGRAGPTFAYYDANGHGIRLNTDRVPAGQTFSAKPGGLGAQP